MKTVGETGAGAAVRVTEGGVVADDGGGSAEATGVDVDSIDLEVGVAVTVPTVRVKLAVTIE